MSDQQMQNVIVVLLINEIEPIDVEFEQAVGQHFLFHLRHHAEGDAAQVLEQSEVFVSLYLEVVSKFGLQSEEELESRVGVLEDYPLQEICELFFL